MAGDIEATVANMLTPLLNVEGFELVAVETAGNRKNQILRLLIHKQDGLSVSDCQVVDQVVRPILEVHQILSEFKQLEIASPGVDRPLTTEPDFRRNIGRTVLIEATKSNGQLYEVQGEVKKSVDGCVTLQQTSGETVHIEIARVCKGYIQLVW